MFVSAEPDASPCRRSLESCELVRQPRRKTLFHNGRDIGINRPAIEKPTATTLLIHCLAINVRGSRHNRPINRAFAGRKGSAAHTQNLLKKKKKIPPSIHDTKRLWTEIAHPMSRYQTIHNVFFTAVVSASKTFPLRYSESQ